MERFALTCFALLFTATGFFGANGNDVIDADRAFSKMSVEHGIVAAFDHYLAEDAIKLDGGAHPRIGHAAIMATLREEAPDAALVWIPRGDMVAASKDLGYTWGTYVLTFREDGEQAEMHGKYTTVWAKRNGEWKAILDTGNSSPGPMPE